MIERTDHIAKWLTTSCSFSYSQTREKDREAIDRNKDVGIEKKLCRKAVSMEELCIKRQNLAIASKTARCRNQFE